MESRRLTSGSGELPPGRFVRFVSAGDPTKGRQLEREGERASDPVRAQPVTECSVMRFLLPRCARCGCAGLCMACS